jgi:hypothetical protein
MGAVTEPRDIKDIEKQLTKGDRIAIISCNTCVRFCNTGGAEKLDQIAHRLRQDGFAITDQVLLTAACVRDYTERSRLSTGITKVIALTCDAGWTSIKQALPSVEVIKANNTLGIMIVSPSNGVLKLMKTYDNYKDRVGDEFELLTGELKSDRVLNLEA